MSGVQWVGVLMVCMVLIGLLAVTVQVHGWRASALLWLFAIGTTVFIIVGVNLAVHGEIRLPTIYKVRT